ncbi:hypothetical protein BGZ93_003416 [Podila epicladia]|nr:hypothetical protein BGZ92_005088 [Podila epicladia]KAG0097117.1 hypothetical protein BGZ93_003416 [Podila epicladia]
MSPEYTPILADADTVVDMSSTEPLLLFGIVDGQSISSAFSVRISPESTVDDLKKLIKVAKAPSFVHIPADELKLVRVSIPYDEQELAPIRLQSLVFKRPLRPIDNLREVFGDPVPRDSIHFIIDTKPLASIEMSFEHDTTFMFYTNDNLICRVVSSKQITLFSNHPVTTSLFFQAFSVNIDLLKTVDGLKQLIRLPKNREPGHVPAGE